MPSISEALSGQSTPLNAALVAGIEQLSNKQTVVFTLYKRLILPLDGFVFWVKADLLNKPAQANAMGANSPPVAGTPASEKTPSTTISADGSLHFTSAKQQDENETYSINRVIFTTPTQLHQAFNQIGDDQLYLASIGAGVPGLPPQGLRFAFSHRGRYYAAAGIWHYTGDSVYPYMESQIIDAVNGFDAQTPVVSNSLPLWLQLNNWLPFYGFSNDVPLYPSYLADPNINPPFATVHIPPESTEVIASIPHLGHRMTHNQLCKEQVKLTMYGLRNTAAMNLIDCVFQYSTDYNYFGIMNTPLIRDEKSQQNEIGILAQKKSITFEISYNQGVVRDIFRQIICQAIPAVETVFPVTWYDYLSPFGGASPLVSGRSPSVPNYLAPIVAPNASSPIG